jgi:hypothetical protein
VNARTRIITVLAIVATLLALAVPALAGSPHFVSIDVTRTGDTLVLDGKEAGLGNETQVEIEFSALAECVNPGSNLPAADNKDEVSVSGTFPVQNGKANFHLELDGAAQISPSCSPPMTIVYSNVTVRDLTHGLEFWVIGTF